MFLGSPPFNFQLSSLISILLVKMEAVEPKPYASYTAKLKRMLRKQERNGISPLVEGG